MKNEEMLMKAVDYSAGQCSAAYSVLGEIVNILGEYSEDMLLIGGWVPALLFPEREHIGSIDVDILLNQNRIKSSEGHYLFDNCIRIFTIEVSDRRNIELLAKYRNAILYSLQFVRNELQNMSFEGYENNGLQYPEANYETTLLDALCSISMYNSSLSKYGYNLGKLYYLEEDWDDYADKRYARLLLEEARGSINQYVHFTNMESDEETIVLVNLALYLESLTRKCLLNKNIPNEPGYRLDILSESQLEELIAEEEPDESQVSAIEELLRQFEEIGG